MRVRLQHKPIGIAESPATERAGAEMLKTRNPITGAPRAREAATQTHTAAESRLRERRRGDAKTDSPQSNYKGRLQHNGGVSNCGRRECVPRAREAAAQTHRSRGMSGCGESRGDVKKPAIRSRECHVRGRLRLQHKPIGVAESPAGTEMIKTP